MCVGGVVTTSMVPLLFHGAFELCVGVLGSVRPSYYHGYANYVRKSSLCPPSRHCGARAHSGQLEGAGA